MRNSIQQQQQHQAQSSKGERDTLQNHQVEEEGMNRRESYEVSPLSSSSPTTNPTTTTTTSSSSSSSSTTTTRTRRGVNNQLQASHINIASSSSESRILEPSTTIPITTTPTTTTTRRTSQLHYNNNNQQNTDNDDIEQMAKRRRIGDSQNDVKNVNIQASDDNDGVDHGTSESINNTKIFQQSLKCPICADVVENNRECTNCHQLFCYKCLAESLSVARQMELQERMKQQQQQHQHHHHHHQQQQSNINNSQSHHTFSSTLPMISNTNIHSRRNFSNDSNHSIHVSSNSSNTTEFHCPFSNSLSRPSTILKCPCCRQEWTKGIDDLPQNVCIERLIMQIEVLCPLKCGLYVARGDITNHQEKYCPEYQIQCQYTSKGCNFRSKRKDMKIHEKEQCPFRETRCDCGAVLIAKELSHHKLHECSLEDTRCPILECNKKLKRSELKHHQIHDCPRSIVQCTFAEFGCPWRGKRIDMDSHFSGNCQFYFMRGFFDEYKKRVKDMETEITNLKSQIVELKSQLKETKRSSQNSTHVLCSVDKTVHVIDVANGGKIVKSLTAHQDHVTCLCIHKDKLLMGCYDRCMRVWDFQNGICLKTHECASVVCSLYSYLGYTFAALFNGCISVWDVEQGKCILTYSDPNAPISVISLTSMKGYIVAGLADGNVLIWDIAINKIIKKLKAHPGFVMKCAPYNSVLYTCSANDKDIKSWDINTGECLSTLTGHSDGVICICCHEKFLISASMDRSIRIWDAENGTCIRTLKSHSVQSLCAYGKTFFSGSRGGNGGSFNIWDIETGNVIQEIPFDGAKLIVSLAVFDEHVDASQINISEEQREREASAKAALDARAHS